MLCSQSGATIIDCGGTSDEDGGNDYSGEGCLGNGGSRRKMEGLPTLPCVLGDLQIISLGNH